MSGQPIGLRHRLAFSRDIFRLYRRGILGNAEADIQFHEELCNAIISNLEIKIGAARILDIGCGQMAPQVALFTADGAEITGIDIEVPSYCININILIQTVKQNGFERAIKSLIRHLIFDMKYIDKLSQCYGNPLQYPLIDTRLMDANNLKFPNDHFDFIVSNSTFEHIDAVPKVVKEMNRVLKPSGLTRISIHLFPSLSGGHHFDWLYPDKQASKKVPPWDHLLENKYRANTFLNKLRLGEYRNIFNADTVVVEEKTVHEGQQLLTPALCKCLSAKGYTKEDLLTRIVTFYCRKKTSATA